MADHEAEGHEVEEAARERHGLGAGLGSGRPLPLNSKRLTGVLLKQLARGLDIPATSSGDELRTLIEGKLGDMGHDPRNTQAVLHEAETGVNISLQDADGVFLTVKPIVVDLGKPDDPPEETVGEGGTESDDEGVEGLKAALREAQEQQAAKEIEIARLQEQLEKEKEKYRKLWSLNCAQLTEFDNAILDKDEEIGQLKAKLHRAEEGTRASSPSTPSEGETESSLPTPSTHRRGRAPPVEMFNGEDSENTLDDWLPSLTRAADWNGWTKPELLIQLAGHLKGRARQEWSLLGESETSDYEKAVRALRARLDPGSKALAAQDFRHAAQEESENVNDFIRRIEKTFRRAYGHDSMLSETRDALLYAQLQEGLKYELMKAPSVSGALSYQALCVAAKSEERRLAELRKRKQYQSPQPKQTTSQPQVSSGGSRFKPGQRSGRSSGASQSKQGKGDNSSASIDPGSRKCWNCNETGHMAYNCPKPRRESTGRSNHKPASTKMVSSAETTTLSPEILDDPLQYLLSDSEDTSEVRQVRIQDEGSKPQRANVTVGGVPMLGVIDTAADVTIIGGEMFKKVAAVAKLRKKDFKPADKTPYNYDRKPFRLDGKLKLDVSFKDCTMTTDVYVKMDASEQLLLSEGVCRQLGIVTYHPEVDTRPQEVSDTVSVPAVKVQLLQSVKLPPRPDQSIIAEVSWKQEGLKGPLLLEANQSLQLSRSIHVADVFVSDADAEKGTAKVVLTNCLGFTQQLESGEEVGRALPVDLVESMEASQGVVSQVGTDETENPNSAEKAMEDRKERLRETLKAELDGTRGEERLGALLEEYHEVFSLSKEDRGETDLIELHIDTGDAEPRKYPVRRVPFAVRDEIARSLEEMQASNVIQPSSSPWASPVVLVRKKDGTLRFCVDYRGLNSVTKLDQFPLPRIDDLLDQLGEAHYFTTLDLASGYWQIRVDKPSREKTAFVTHHGLFEFRVMPFGLTNAPAVFQRLMQKVLSGLKTESGKDFVEVYIDDVLIFSETLEGHLEHIRLVLERLKKAGLKLKPSKCHFLRESVEYLGHLITPQGLKPNPKQVKAVVEFPIPESVTNVRQFLGLTSYYRRFIAQFAKVAAPLHALTRKEAVFEWSTECQRAFESLKAAITQSPVLSYPNFQVDFVLETDASVKGLGAVLSQQQDDGVLHPVAFASRSLSPTERNYSVTDLETLAVVWAMQHFRAYLYGHKVTVVTDHSAVKTVLGAPCSSGKHARWWLKVFGSGVKDVQIVYRPGRENDRADALSRNPVAMQESNHLEVEARVSQVIHNNEKDISDLLQEDTGSSAIASDFHLEQRKDPELETLFACLEHGELPADPKEAQKLTVQALNFAVVDELLCFVDQKAGHRKRVVVPAHLRENILKESHGGVYAGHFSGGKLYSTICRKWWWPTIYRDVMDFCKSCPDCAVVSGTGRKYVPPLHPIPVQRPFQIFGVDIMELPITERGNRYVIVFQDFLTKWPLVFPAPDQKAIRIARLVAEEIVPMFGVPESLLSDRGANLLANVMMDVCSLLGITKLNTTAYHPQCNGMIERMNRTLKAMLRKHAVKFGPQWDKFLPGVLWAYRNSPHETTKEKPSFLMFGLDLRSPTEAALLPIEPPEPSDVGDYREELILSLSSARELAATNIHNEQKRTKERHDNKSNVKPHPYKIGDWVLVRFPQEETGKKRKLSKPWHGPYRVTQKNDPDVTVVPVHFPESGSIQVHQSRVCCCPPKWPTGFYWYGGNKLSRGGVPRWLEKLLSHEPAEPEDEIVSAEDTTSPEEDDTTTETSDVLTPQEEEIEPTNDASQELLEPETDQTTPTSDRSVLPNARYNLRHAVKPPDRLVQQVIVRDEHTS